MVQSPHSRKVIERMDAAIFDSKWYQLKSERAHPDRSYETARVLVSGRQLPDAIHFLRSTGTFDIAEVSNNERAVDCVRRQSFDVVLLDNMPPGLGIIEACEQIRALEPRIGIILFSVPDSEEERVRALESGADYCFTKPLQKREIVARLRALLRRAGASGARQPMAPQTSSLELDFERRSVWKGATEISLSQKEFDLLALLMNNEGIPLKRADLLETLWGPKRREELQYLRVYILRLRQRIEDDPSDPRYILTEPWHGYRFCDPAKGLPESRSASPEIVWVDHRSLWHQLPHFNQAKLELLHIDEMREALRVNEISFPSQVPTFERHDRPDLQWKIVQLYFVLGWSCERIAERYGFGHQRVGQILTTWKRRAVETGYVQYIPPEQHAAQPELHPKTPEVFNLIGREAPPVLAIN